MKKLPWPEHRMERLFDCYAYLNNDLKTKAYAAWVNPSDFLAATTPIGSRNRIESEARPLNRPSLDAEDQEIFLRGRIDLDKRMFVLDGHEGRHRMVALRNAGFDRVAITVCMGQGQEAETLSGLFVPPQRWSEDHHAENGFLLGRMTPISWSHRSALKDEFFAPAPLEPQPWENPGVLLNGRSVARNFVHWFRLSQVVDGAGLPLVVHHSGFFEESGADGDGHLKFGAQGMHFGTLAAAQSRDIGKRVDDFIVDLVVEQSTNEAGAPAWYWRSDGIDSGDLDGEGFATEALARANGERFAMDQEFQDTEPMPILQAFLRIQNPKRVPDQGKDWTACVALAKAEGHDGIVYRNAFEDKGSASFIAFEAHQVKSVRNSGLFLRESASPTDQAEHAALVLGAMAKAIARSAPAQVKAAPAEMRP